MKTKEEKNAIKEESLTEVVGGQEPAEFDWQGKEYITPVKEDITEGHIFEPIGSKS